MTSTYRPENVRVVDRDGSPYGPTFRFLLLDHDGTELQWFESRADAESRARSRRGVIRAALTRRANKAKASR